MRKPRVLLAAASVAATVFLVVGISTPALAAPPVLSININCTKLASAVDPQASFDTPVTKRSLARVEERFLPEIPEADYVQMSGGLACDWSNGQAIDLGTDNGAVGVEVGYMPFQAAGYFRSAPPGSPADEFNCFDITVVACQLDSPVGGDWLLVDVQGARSDAVAESLARRISDALQVGQKTPHVAPVYASPVPTTCASLVRPSIWRVAIGSHVPLVPFPAPPGWEEENQAMSVTNDLFCDYDSSDGDHGGGSLQSLAGGRWGFRQVRDLLTAPGALTPISVPAMRSGDAAFTRCDVAHKHCYLDALIATHWIEVDLWTTDRGGDLITRDRLAALRTLLTEVVHNIY